MHEFDLWKKLQRSSNARWHLSALNDLKINRPLQGCVCKAYIFLWWSLFSNTEASFHLHSRWQPNVQQRHCDRSPAHCGRDVMSSDSLRLHRHACSVWLRAFPHGVWGQNISWVYFHFKAMTPFFPVMLVASDIPVYYHWYDVYYHL